MLSIGRTAAWELVRKQKIKSVKIGRTRRVPIVAIQEYIQRLRIQGWPCWESNPDDRFRSTHALSVELRGQIRWLRAAPSHCRHSIQSPSALRRQSLVSQVEPDGVNYHTPSPIAEGIWDHFHDHIIRRIHIRIDLPPPRGLEHPALHPLSNIL